MRLPRTAVPGWRVTIAVVGASLVAPTLPAAGQESPATPLERSVVVASKPFAESFILGEIFAQLLEDRGFAVERRPGLGSTAITFQALQNGQVDVYPEYTGTAVQAILGEAPDGGPVQVYERVARVFLERWGIRLLGPLGFENTYAIAVRPETAESLGLNTLSDLARVGGELTAGFTADFLGRADGLPGLANAYGLELGTVRPLEHSLKYQAMEQAEVDVIDGYSTDAGVERLGLTVLTDDLGFFPPYQAVPMVSAELAREAPQALAVLGELTWRIDVDAMRRMNAAVEAEGRTVEAVAREFLVGTGLVSGGATDPVGNGLDGAEGGLDGPVGGADGAASLYPTDAGPFDYLFNNLPQTGQQALRHIFLVGLSLGLALLIALPGGLALERLSGARAEAVIRGAGVLQTIPSIALLAFMIPVLGIGVPPAVAALFLYSLFPILRNTYTGVRDADPEAVAAGEALGMTPLQVLTQIRLPLAAPVLMAGVRTAAVINVGTATLAAFIGAGGLGDPIVAGLALADGGRVLAGALPAAVLALLVDFTLAGVERWVTPRGLDVRAAD